MKPSLQKSIYSFFFKEKNSWINSGELERMVFKNRNGTVAKPTSVTRRIRELEEMRLIAVKYEGATQSALYKFIPRELRANYIPVSKRPGHKKNVMWKIPIAELANSNKPADKEMEEFWNSLPTD